MDDGNRANFAQGTTLIGFAVATHYNPWVGVGFMAFFGIILIAKALLD